MVANPRVSLVRSVIFFTIAIVSTYPSQNIYQRPCFCMKTQRGLSGTRVTAFSVYILFNHMKSGPGICHCLGKKSRSFSRQSFRQKPCIKNPQNDCDIGKQQRVERGGHHLHPSPRSPNDQHGGGPGRRPPLGPLEVRAPAALVMDLLFSTSMPTSKTPCPTDDEKRWP